VHTNKYPSVGATLVVTLTYGDGGNHKGADLFISVVREFFGFIFTILREFFVFGVSTRQILFGLAFFQSFKQN
jgi:hypothetical protein